MAKDYDPLTCIPGDQAVRNGSMQRGRKPASCGFCFRLPKRSKTEASQTPGAGGGGR